MTNQPFDPASLAGRSFYKDTYVVDALVDEGGFSYLYRGRRKTTGTRVAIKVLKAEPDRESELLLQEAHRQRDARENSEVIVEVYEILPASDPDNELGADLFVMEWVEGHNLNTPPGEAGQIPPRERLLAHLRIAVDIAKGLEALHRDGLWHGDLTPSNVLAYHREVDGWGAKLIDLGLSREQGYRGRTAGTALYMAPEQIGQHDRADYDSARADLYALGAVLFNLFAGEHYLASLAGRAFARPLTPEEGREVARAIRDEPPRRLSQAAPHVPDELSDLVASLLEKDPARRAGDIREVRERLEEICDRQKAAAYTSLQTEKPTSLVDLLRWDVRLLVYREKEGRLVPELIPLGILESGEPAVLHSPPLWLAEEQRTAHIIFVENTSRQAIASVQIRPGHQPYRVFFELQADNTTHFSTDAEAGDPRTLIVTDPFSEYRAVALREEEVVIDLAFLIDGTMSAEALNLARNFCLWTAHEAASLPLPLRLACVVYGEYKDYPHPPHRRRRIPYDVRYMDFSEHQEVYDYLSQQVTYSDQFMDQDWADAMELGLRQAGKLSWESSDRWLVIVGNSPPHPAAGERRRYHLLDFTTEEFQNIRWRDEVAGLQESGKLRLAAAYIKPPIGLDPGQEEYITAVWKELDDTHPDERRELTDSSLNTDVRKLVEQMRKQHRQRQVPTAPAVLPLLKDGD